MAGKLNPAWSEAGCWHFRLITGAVTVCASVLGGVKCPERRQSAGGRLPWQARRRRAGVRRKGGPRAGGAEAACSWAGRRGCTMQELGLSGPSRAPLGWEGRGRAWLGFNSHTSNKGGLPGGAGGVYWLSAAVAVGLPTRTRVCKEVKAQGLSRGAERGSHPGGRSVILLLWTRIHGLCPSSLGFSRT